MVFAKQRRALPRSFSRDRIHPVVRRHYPARLCPAGLGLVRLGAARLGSARHPKHLPPRFNSRASSEDVGEALRDEELSAAQPGAAPPGLASTSPTLIHSQCVARGVFCPMKCLFLLFQQLATFKITLASGFTTERRRQPELRVSTPPSPRAGCVCSAGSAGGGCGRGVGARAGGVRRGSRGQGGTVPGAACASPPRPPARGRWPGRAGPNGAGADLRGGAGPCGRGPGRPGAGHSCFARLCRIVLRRGTPCGPQRGPHLGLCS